MMYLHRFHVTLIAFVVMMTFINDVSAFNAHGIHAVSRRLVVGQSSTVPLSFMTTKHCVDGTTSMIRPSQASSSAAILASSSSSSSPLFSTARKHRRKRHWNHALRSTASSDLASPSPDGDAEKGTERSFSYRFERRLLQILLFPLKLIIMKPLRMLIEFFIDNLDDDGTVQVTGDDVVSASESDNESAGITTTTMLATTEIPIIGNDQTTIKKVSDGLGTIAYSDARPVGDRWALSAPGVDLTGQWELIVDDDFRKQYDEYLTRLDQPLLVRSVALSIIGQTKEETIQTDHGRSLLIRGKNVRGVWDRTLVASGTDGQSKNKDDYIPLQIPIMSADSEQVEAESWWENNGQVHVSWLRGVTKYGGGAFQSRRYLTDDDDIYVCETVFYPSNTQKDPNPITWRFRRQGGKP